MLFIDFYGIKYAALLRFGLRLCLTALTVFVLLPDMSIWAKLAATVYMIVFLSFFSYVISDKFSNIGAICFVMFAFNLFTALFLQRSPFMAEHGQLFSILTAVSSFSILSFFMIQNIDSSRRFGVDVIKLPSTTKRVMLVIIAIFCIIVILLSVLPWITEAFDALLSFARNILSQLSGIISFDFDPLPGQRPVPPPQPPLIVEPDEDAPISEPGLLYQIIMRVSLVILIAFMLFALIFALVKFTIFIIKLFKTDRQRPQINSEVFTETIEKVLPNRKEQKVRSYFKRPRYSSLLTDRERIFYIYKEYVRRAKRSGLTHDSLNDTPNEVLDEITKNVSGSNFPLPESLSTVFNLAKYGDPVTEITEVHELKQRLF